MNPTPQSANVIDIRDAADLADRVLAAPGPTAVCFYADWCPDCRRFAPTFAALADQYAGRVRFARVDVQRLPELESHYAIGLIPSVLLLDGGRVIRTWEFIEDPAQYRAVLDALFPTGPGDPT